MVNFDGTSDYFTRGPELKVSLANFFDNLILTLTLFDSTIIHWLEDHGCQLTIIHKTDHSKSGWVFPNEETKMLFIMKFS